MQVKSNIEHPDIQEACCSFHETIQEKLMTFRIQTENVINFFAF